MFSEKQNHGISFKNIGILWRHNELRKLHSIFPVWHQNGSVPHYHNIKYTQIVITNIYIIYKLYLNFHLQRWQYINIFTINIFTNIQNSNISYEIKYFRRYHSHDKCFFFNSCAGLCYCLKSEGRASKKKTCDNEIMFHSSLIFI